MSKIDCLRGQRIGLGEHSHFTAFAMAAGGKRVALVVISNRLGVQRKREITELGLESGVLFKANINARCIEFPFSKGRVDICCIDHVVDLMGVEYDAVFS